MFIMFLCVEVLKNCLSFYMDYYYLVVFDTLLFFDYRVSFQCFFLFLFDFYF